MNNIIVTSIDYILNWSRANSLWPLTFATSCCGIEMMQTVASDNDIARFGSEVFRGSPRQADLLICAGTITHKMAPVLLRLYEQMPEPKYVIAMGACTCGGGMFADSSYSVIKGIDKTYINIYEGNWFNDSTYYTIHRFASSFNKKHAFHEAIKLLTKDIKHIRIDTHADNKIMQKAIINENFKYAGIIYLENGDPRMAYELVI